MVKILRGGALKIFTHLKGGLRKNCWARRWTEIFTTKGGRGS